MTECYLITQINNNDMGKITREEALRFATEMVNMVYDLKELEKKEINLTEEAVKSLINKTPVKHLVNLPTTHLETKKLLMSKKGQKGYEVDIDVLRDMYEEFIGLSDYGTLRDPKKSREVMEAILSYNSNTITGYGRVTEPQVHALDAVGEVLGMETLEFLTDEV